MCFSFKPQLFFFFLFPSFLGHWGLVGFACLFFCRLKGDFSAPLSFCSIMWVRVFYYYFN